MWCNASPAVLTIHVTALLSFCLESSKIIWHPFGKKMTVTVFRKDYSWITSILELWFLLYMKLSLFDILFISVGFHWYSLWMVKSTHLVRFRVVLELESINPPDRSAVWTGLSSCQWGEAFRDNLNNGCKWRILFYSLWEVNKELIHLITSHCTFLTIFNYPLSRCSTVSISAETSAISTFSRYNKLLVKKN